MAWIGTLCFLALLLRVRVLGLVVLVAPAAFLGVFVAALLAARRPAPRRSAGSGSLAARARAARERGPRAARPRGARERALPRRAPPAQGEVGAAPSAPVALARGARPRERDRAGGGLHAAHARRRDGHALDARGQRAARSAAPPTRPGRCSPGPSTPCSSACASAAARDRARRALAAVVAFGFLFFAVIGVELLA